MSPLRFVSCWVRTRSNPCRISGRLASLACLDIYRHDHELVITSMISMKPSYLVHMVHIALNTNLCCAHVSEHSTKLSHRCKKYRMEERVGVGTFLSETENRTVLNRNFSFFGSSVRFRFLYLKSSVFGIVIGFHRIPNQIT
jgi:hypothetical protein